MCGYFCIGFIDFMFANMTLKLKYFKKNDKIIFDYFK